MPILMPQAGNSMEEGTILSWKVAEGDSVQTGQVLCEIETDKATMEYESPADGTIARLLAAENEVVPVKQPMALLAAPGVDVSAALASWGDAGSAGGSSEGSALPAGAQGNAASKPASGGGASAAASGDTLGGISGGEGSAGGGGASGGTSGAAGVAAVLMPQAGNSMEEGTLLAWKVAEGESVSVGQVLCEIETDKATMEHEATEAGVLIKQVAAEGDVVAVKQPIAFLAVEGADLEAAKSWVASGGWQQSSDEQGPGSGSAASAVSDAVAPAVAGSASVGMASAVAGSRIRATPAARKQARERGLDIESLVAGHGFIGSGPGGRVLSTDLAKLASLGRPAAKAAMGPATSGGQVVRRPMSKMRRAIANNLVASKQNVPHFYVRQSINASKLLAFQKRNKPATGCTINDCIIMGVAQVMMEYPGFRSQIEGSEVVEYPHANIGIAVGVPDGLVVPVTMEADRFPLAELAARNRRLVEDARRGKVDRMGEGQFSISNMGMFGVEEFSAIINPPESGILAVAAIREAVLVEDGALKPGRVMTMTLSADHRLVDGTLAGQFMARLRELLESPDEMFAERIG